MVDIIPAILSYTQMDLDRKVSSMASVASAIHIDIMDGVFVKNKTIGTNEASKINFDRDIEFHLMVSDPQEYIGALPGGPKVTFQVHIESAKGRMDQIISAVRAKNSKLALVLNPITPIETITPYLGSVQNILLMTVVPGIDGQKYMPEVEKKITQLRQMAPGINIEVDGGVNTATALAAVRAGANRLAAATAIFGQPDKSAAYRNLHALANGH